MKLLETYLKNNHSNIHKLHRYSSIPETTLRNLNSKKLELWNLKILTAVANLLEKDVNEVIKELGILSTTLITDYHLEIGKYNLANRRYIGSKSKLLTWIKDLVRQNTTGSSFTDLFAGTGIVSEAFLDDFDILNINDFLFSNFIIYNGFFGSKNFDKNKLLDLEKKFQDIDPKKIEDNYSSINYGGKFFSLNDAKIIGYVRDYIEHLIDLTFKEKSILLASLIYSVDKVANTVGHYDAFRKKIDLKDRFKFELIQPINTKNKSIHIYNSDANELSSQLESDIVFIDPPYNSRQYSRFYHVLENITIWDKPDLEGVALKPPVKNMSLYSKNNAPIVFDNLIKGLKCKYIVVTYNNTYNSKSNSSKNKISHDQILKTMDSVGSTKVFEKPFRFFNAGKSTFDQHKEFVFITKVKR